MSEPRYCEDCGATLDCLCLDCQEKRVEEAFQLARRDQDQVTQRYRLVPIPTSPESEEPKP